ncbi:MAG TPA: VWA domain-containing protein [Terriglobales bacterium]|nr:VWA domain-containing protein [Terriglobales bacterium]
MRGMLFCLIAVQALCAFVAAQDITTGNRNAGNPELITHAGPQLGFGPSMDSNARADVAGWTFRVQVSEVTVPFSVTNRNKAVAGVTAQDVRITDDGKPVQNVAYFGHLADLPLRFGLVIDSSDSIIQRSYFEEEAAKTFLHRVLQKETDQAFVMHFTSQSRFVQDLTTNVKQLDSAIAALNPKGTTGMYDAVYAACKRLQGMRDRQRLANILVLISDGDDNVSQTSLERVIAMAHASEVSIFSVSSNGGMKTRATRNLRQLSEETGGRAFFVDESSQLVKAFTALGQEMRDRYVISYRPVDLKDDGRYHRIQLQVQKDGTAFKVLSRRGYYANPAD